MMFPKNKRIEDQEYYIKYQLEHPFCEFIDCGEPGHLGPHHIIFRSQQGDDSWENLIRLCEYHHTKAHKDEAQLWRRLFQTYKEYMKEMGWE
jgi:5-methylcytosine-specific restriction endonuclease McrA